MKTNILKLANRSVLYCIYEDFGLDAKNFEMFKNRYEDDFKGFSFKDAKKQVIKDVFTNKMRLNLYLEDNKYDLLCNKCLGEEYVKEMTELITFLENYSNSNFTESAS